MKERIKQLCKERKTTLKEVAAHMEITPESLTRAIGGKGGKPGKPAKPANPTLSTLRGIAEALDVDLYELFISPDGKRPMTDVHGVIWIGGKPTIIKSLADLKELVNLYSIGKT